MANLVNRANMAKLANLANLSNLAHLANLANLANLLTWLIWPTQPTCGQPGLPAAVHCIRHRCWKLESWLNDWYIAVPSWLSNLFTHEAINPCHLRCIFIWNTYYCVWQNRIIEHTSCWVDWVSKISFDSVKDEENRIQILRLRIQILQHRDREVNATLFRKTCISRIIILPNGKSIIYKAMWTDEVTSTRTSGPVPRSSHNRIIDFQ